MTNFGNKNSTEYFYRKDLLDKLIKQINILKNKRKKDDVNNNRIIKN